MKKIIIKFLIYPIFLFPFKKLIELFLKNPYIFKLQQKINNYNVVGNEFQEYLKSKDKKILEVGCSTGNLARQIIDMDSNSYYGVDISKEYINIATKSSPKGKFLQMDARKLDFHNEFFDIIMLSSVLHHIDDEVGKNCFKEVHRVLKKDGVVIIAEPILNSKSLISIILCKLDRGHFIRTTQEYKILFTNFMVKTTNHFKFGGHFFCSFVLKK
jgi:ubiquinone/menaquinone biosynthesis C-methylase UbiE|tara:strand:+ start:299 stop:940 length:642 start_codon:yes stop_codon:yes gene_type:complete